MRHSSSFPIQDRLLLCATFWYYFGGGEGKYRHDVDGNWIPRKRFGRKKVRTRAFLTFAYAVASVLEISSLLLFVGSSLAVRRLLFENGKEKILEFDGIFSNEMATGAKNLILRY